MAGESAGEAAASAASSASSEAAASASAATSLIKGVSLTDLFRHLRNVLVLGLVGWGFCTWLVNASDQSKTAYLYIFPLIYVTLSPGTWFFLIMLLTGFVVYSLMRMFIDPAEKELLQLKTQVMKLTEEGGRLKKEVEIYSRSAGEIMIPYNLNDLIRKNLTDISTHQFNPAALTIRPSPALFTPNEHKAS